MNDIKYWQMYFWNYNMEDVYSQLYQRWTGARPNRPLKPVNRVDRDITSLYDLWEQLNPTIRPEDKRTSVLHMNLLNSIHRMIDLDGFVRSSSRLVEKMMGTIMKNGPNVPVSYQKFGNLAEVDYVIPNELGWPTRMFIQVPMVSSIHGNVKVDLVRGSLETDAVARIGWKLWSQMRTDLPWCSQYIASGVDVRVDLHAPRNINLQLVKNGQLKAVWNLGHKVHDMIHFHVKPYTVSRDWWSTWSTPQMEDTTHTRIISMEHRPSFERNWTVPAYGANLQLSMHSELPHNDWSAWASWAQNFDLNSWFNLFFIPFNVHQRQYRLQYVPEASQLHSVDAFLCHLPWWKSGNSSKTYMTGSRNGNTKTYQRAETIPMYLKPTVDRLFAPINSGSADIFYGSLRFIRKDGSRSELVSSYGYAHDHINFKAYRDLRITHAMVDATRTRARDFAVCGSSTKSWTQVPAFGLSSEPLYQTEDAVLTLGENCQDGHNITVKTRLVRDHVAATWAHNTSAAADCRRDIESGLLDSRRCHEARQLDQTFNVYELDADVPTLSAEYLSSYSTPLYWLFSKHVAPFVISQDSKTERNQTTRWSLKAVREPWSGDVDLKLHSPNVSIEARNMFWSSEKLSWPAGLVLPTLFPVQAESSLTEKLQSRLSDGTSQAQCYVGVDRVTTYDDVSYNYTMTKCNHVLVTDCYQNSRFAVLARHIDNRKVIQVVMEKDTVEIDPVGRVSINGVSSPLEIGNRFEIFDGENMIASVWWVGKAIKFQSHQFGFHVVVGDSQVTVSAPWNLRGRTCGLCGDFDQEKTHEFKTSARCAVSSGSIMAASYHVTSLDTKLIAIMHKHLLFNDN